MGADFVVEVPPRCGRMIGKFVVLWRADVGECAVARIISMTDGQVVYQIKEGKDYGKKFSSVYGRSTVKVFRRMSDALAFWRVVRRRMAA